MQKSLFGMDENSSVAKRKACFGRVLPHCLRAGVHRFTLRCLLVWIVMLVIWNILSTFWVMEVKIKIPSNLKLFKVQDNGRLIIVETQKEQNETGVVEVRSGFFFGAQAINDSTFNLTHHNRSLNKAAVKRPKRCNGCFNMKFEYVFENKICLENKTNNSSQKVLVFLIFTKHGNDLQRDALRRTWLSNISANSSYIFVLGVSKNQSQNEKIANENRIHKDILLINFEDTYQNLTLKTISSFKWLASRCSDVKYVMKVDDDMWVNIDLLYGMMKSGLFRNSLTGSCNYASRPFRNKKSKYYVSYSMYPDHVYPPFCSGTGYILDFAVMEDIVNVSKNIPFFPLEDVYIGFCMRELGKSVVTMMSFHSFKIFLNSCIYKSEIILTSHGLSASDLIDIWNTPCNFPKFHGNILAFQGRGLGAEPKGLPRRQFMHRNRQMGLRRQQLHGKGPKNYNFRLPVKRPVKYRKRPGT